MMYFEFEKPEVKIVPYLGEKRTLYRMVNLVKRTIDGHVIASGMAGGYVEHPELLDRNQNIFVDNGAYVAGNTTLVTPDDEGVIIRNAVVIDCRINGAVTIGSTVADVKKYTPAMAAARKNKMVVQRSTIIGSADLADFAYISDSTIKGEGNVVCESAHVLKSRLLDGCFVTGNADLVNVTAVDSSFSDKAFSMNNFIEHSELFKDAELTGKDLHNRKLSTVSVF